MKDLEDKITFFVHGPIYDPPDFGTLQQYNLLPPTVEDLFKGRMEALHNVSTPYFCMLDGGPDRLLPRFPEAIKYLLQEMESKNTAIGMTLETSRRVGHGGTVCRTELAQDPRFPREGEYHFESLIYNWLKLHGISKWTVEPVYQWNIVPGSASSWPNTVRSVMRSVQYIQRLRKQ